MPVSSGTGRLLPGRSLQRPETALPALLRHYSGCAMGKEEGSLVSLARVTINAPAEKVRLYHLWGRSGCAREQRRFVMGMACGTFKPVFGPRES